MTGWIGVDLDGTLAEYHGWDGEHKVGSPIPLMAQRVKKWLKEGVEVRIFTARVAVVENTVITNKARMLPHEIASVIQDWTEKHFGVRLVVTNQKDYGMIELWDDRAVQVVPNTGERADEPTDLKTYRHAYALALRVLISCYEEKREIGPGTLLVVKHLLEDLKK